ncbi:hypothetical protein AA21952_0238 [Acetobacter oeni LMG 21952]|nr:hypothetical protein AA21952_0238 [Acetobacter oeni LMG 21952]
MVVPQLAPWMNTGGAVLPPRSRRHPFFLSSEDVAGDDPAFITYWHSRNYRTNGAGACL